MKHFIRSATETDLSNIVTIENASFASDIQESPAVFLDRIKTFPEGTLLFFESKELQASGYFSSEIWSSVPPPHSQYYSLGHSSSERHDPQGSVLYISSFAVLPSSRGGTGRLLFKGARSLLCKQFPLLQTIIFIVHEDWLAARHIYETEGFSYTGTLPHFFGESNALIMEKRL